MLSTNLRVLNVLYVKFWLILRLLNFIIQPTLMKLITIKKLKDGSFFIDGNVNFIGGLFLFIIIFIPLILSRVNLLLSFIIASVFTAFVLACVAISSSFGKKVHSKIFERKVFTELRQRGFQKENIDRYEGLIKTIDDRTVRVFYNWNKFAEGFLSFGDIEINIFYKPQLLEMDNQKIDIEKLKKLNKKYNSFFSSKTKRYAFDFDRLKVSINYYPWTTSHKIQKEIYKGLDILKEQGMPPFDIRKVSPEYIHIEKGGWFYPNMEYIWESFNKKKELPPVKIE